jgi:hypothetical protein
MRRRLVWKRTELAESSCPAGGGQWLVEDGQRGKEGGWGTGVVRGAARRPSLRERHGGRQGCPLFPAPMPHTPLLLHHAVVSNRLRPWLTSFFLADCCQATPLARFSVWTLEVSLLFSFFAFFHQGLRKNHLREIAFFLLLLLLLQLVSRRGCEPVQPR